ncbi:MAG: DUF11 domain-containing protein [Planctomycetes bacterium]|nr:DUF11 domain-containing protein [Planctomycetota bacterium]
MDTHTARVEWGDGTTDPLPLNEAPFGPPGFFRGADGQGFGEFTHIYNDVGTFGVKVCVLDNDGGEGCDDIGVVDVQLVDLFVTKNVSPAPGTPIPVGSELTYTLNVSNNGPGYAPDVRVTDVLPDGMELVSAMRSGEGRIETKLVPADAACEDGHGLSVDVSDEYMLVSSPQKDQGLGAVYIYKATGAVWTEHQKLTTTISSLFGAGFGSDVAIEGDTAAIGAPGENSGAGAVHVFQNSNGIWTDRAALVTTNGAPGDRFGFDVSLSGDTIAVGAEKAGANEIIIYEFDGTTWTPQDSISIGLDNGPGFEFALDVDTLAVIVRPTFSNPGTLTIYRRTNGTWNTEAVIVEATVAGLPTPNSFAHSVAIGGDVIVVGHRETIGDGIPSTASVFERSGSTWTQQTTLAANDGAENDAFGSSVDIDGSTIVVGARLRDNGKGAVYLFDRDGSNWSQTGRLTVSDGQFGDRLGESIAIDGATIVGGAPLADDFDSNGAPIFAGAAYVFATCPQSPRGTVTCGLGTIANGDSVEVVIVARAGCSLADDPFVSTTLVNNADALAHALEANLTDNHASVTSTTASPPQGVCGADFTPPIVSPVVSGTLGDNGWYTSDVVVTWVTSDPDSPISNLTGCDVTTVEFDTQGFTVTCVATSVGGVTSNGVTIKRDTTRPSISPVLVGTNGLNGWYTSDVQITFVCTDGVSDIASCEGATTLTDEGQNSCQFGTARDQAGNISTALVDGIMIDKTPPTITASRTAANANGWNNTDVAVTFECIDGTSGIGFCPPVATLTGEGAAQSVDGIATDLAGNPATVTVNDINIDKTQPVIVANASPVANASGWQNSIVTVSFVCTDGLSGVQSCTPADVMDVEGSNLRTSGTVIDLAGNTASASEGGINIDWTPPTITASVSPPANANGANATPVTIGYLCSDDRSGVSACPTDVLLSDYGFGQSVASEVVDLAGNTTLLSVGGINIGVPVVSTTADLTVTEGEQIDMILATATPYPATTGTASIEWGDQTIRDTAMATTSGLVADLSGAHVYADDGIYNVEICIGDLIGRPTCQTLAVTVVNLPPTLLSVESPTKPVEFGTAARLNALFNDLGTSDTHTATIDWGEGSGHEAVSVIEAPFGAPGDTLGQDGNIEADHFYAAPGNYPGEVCVTDDEGESTCALFSVTVAAPSTTSCSISVGPATCTNGIASVGLEVTVTGHQGVPTAFVWDDDNPDGVYNSVDDNDFGDATSQSPTLIAQAFTQFNVFCTVAFPDDSGLESIVCEAPITPCVSGEINSWSSVRSHGSAGEIGIPLDASKTANDLGSNGSNSEPRRGGIQKILVTFDEVMVPVNAALEPSDISVVDQTLVGHVPMAVSLDEGLRGTTLVIEFLDGALPDAALYTIDLAGALRSEVGGTLLSGDTDCVILSVVGDADQDGETSSIDIDLILTRQGEGVLSAPNARLDINADGVINLIDVAIAQASLGNGIQSGSSAPTALDFDLDGDLDIDDYAEFSSCITGPNNDPTVTLQPGCTEQTRTMADLDQDNDVDLRDFADFQLGFGE